MFPDVNNPRLPFGLNNIHRNEIEVVEGHLELLNELNEQLRAYAHHFHVSLASLCHLAWAQVLARSSGTQTVVFGTVLFDHSQADDGNEDVLINSLPIQIDIDGTTVEKAVHKTYARLSALMIYDNVIPALTQCYNGAPNDRPTFSALLEFRHDSKTKHVSKISAGTRFPKCEKQMNHPLYLAVEDDDSKMSLSVQVVSPISALRICAYMQQALESLVDALANTPERSIRTLTVIPPEEREMLLKHWNNTAATFSHAYCLHELFEAQVARRGEKTAIEYEGETMSYAELNIKANRLAHHLITQGVKPDDLIALCVERSIKMLIAILGVLKSGAAYVPLDPVYSSHRIGCILTDSKPLGLLIDATGHKAIGESVVPMINLDAELPTNLSIVNPNPIKLGLTPAHLAYVIYTSGSTGTPKGVMVEHRQVINFLHTIDRTCDFNYDDIWCLFTTISFDISVFEIGGAWYYGEKLVIVPQEITRSPHEFYQLICEKYVTVLIHTPSALKNFYMAETKSTQSNSLRWVIFGAEPTDSVSLRAWYMTQNRESLRMCHMYGPTEATVAATSWMYDITIPENAPLPIGRPLPNIRTYLLDSFGELVPLGVEGELYIAGAGVTRGYLNRPELTTERFLPDPFSEAPTARMYRTGDRARYLPDGNLVFCGRIDQQMKIRGFRIEPGEIESRLIEHPLVREAIVQLWSKYPGTNDRLVAYVIANPDSSLTHILRSYLASLLPDYMVPSAYVCLSSFPLTSNGKIDRRALPAPEDDAIARQLFVAPRGEMEEKLAIIWSELLNIECISRHDNFFALGGHSLLIVRMLSQLQQTGFFTSIREVFDTPSLAALARTLSYHKPFSTPPNLIAADCTMITPEMLPLINLSQAEIDVIVEQVPGGVSNIQDIYGLAPLQHGILFHHMMAERGDPYLLIDHIEFKDRIVLERYASALQKLIERHDILRTVFIWKGLNEPAQIVLRHVPSILTEITSNDTNEPVLEQLCNRFNPREYKIDLKEAPLLRLIAASIPDGSWIALQLMHHIIGDNVTMQTLNAEVQAIMNGKIDELATPTHFRNVVAQVRLFASQVDYKGFFTEMLADVDTPTLPFGLNNIHLNIFEVNEKHMKIPKELNNQLRAHARLFHVSSSSLCHLAWAQVLARTSGTDKVVFGTVLFGRLQSGEESENAIGLLINTLPLRIDIDKTSVKNAVRHTHARLSGLLMHEHATLALVQRCSRVPNGLPLFSALLNYRHNLQTEHAIEPSTGITILNGEWRTNYPIFLSVDDNLDSMSLEAQMISSISASRICEYMKQTLVSLVDALTSLPQRPIRTLTVIPPEEREKLLKSFNDTATTFPNACCLHELFETQVAYNGQAIACECEGQTMTYTQLNCEANKLAHYLIAQGVKPDDCIAVCVKRSIKMIIAVLGILKSGAAYVPLDPNYSRQRLTSILQDSKPMCLLVDSTCVKTLEENSVLKMNLDETFPANLSVDNRDPNKLGLTTIHLAYIIYTSGSTGTPKGVMVEHRQVINFLHAIDHTCDFTDKDVWCLFHSFSFDLSVSEIGLAWYYGGKLVIVPQDIIRSPSDLYQLICEQGVTVLIQTPAALRMFHTAQSESTQAHRLRWIIFGGDATEPVSLRRWYKTQDTDNLRMVQMYGPTETTIFSTSWMHDMSLPENASLPLGRPLSNIQHYVLDAHGDIVPLGARTQAENGLTFLMYVGRHL